MIEKIKWDSRFFGFGVGRSTLAELINIGKDSIHEQMKHLRIHLLYIFNNPIDSINSEKYEPYKNSIGAKLVDQKITYVKHLDDIIYEKNQIEGAVTSYSNKQPNEQLFSLALQSGIYSRFRLDNRFPEGSYERLYKKWIENSVNGKIADKVLITKNEENMISGMLSLSHKMESSEIGLIAVDKKERGKKLGQQLMKAAENESFKIGNSIIKVATQKNNQLACSFYEGMDYEIMEIIEIYHLWRNKKD